MQFLKLSQATKTAVTSREVVKFCISTSLKCILYLEWSGSEKEMSGWSLKKSGFIVLPRQVFLHTQIQKIKSTSTSASSLVKIQIYTEIQGINFEWPIHYEPSFYNQGIHAVLHKFSKPAKSCPQSTASLGSAVINGSRWRQMNLSF